MAQSVKNPRAVQETACNVIDQGSVPGSGRSPQGGNGNPLQCSSWGIPWAEEPGGYSAWGRKGRPRRSSPAARPGVCLRGEAVWAPLRGGGISVGTLTVSSEGLARHQVLPSWEGPSPS